MFNREVLRKSFGYPFTTKKKVLEVMDYKDYAYIRPYFFGLPRVKSKYFTDDVIDNIFKNIEYTDE